MHTSDEGTTQSARYVIDAENAAEMARLMVQDRLLTEAMGGPFAEQEDLSSIHQVLDIGCGPGGWLLDVASHFPHIQGVGIDISQLMIAYAANLARARALLNVAFRVMDATGPLDFAAESFDLVNGRILSGFLSTSGWGTLLQECRRITRPGGILRLTEPEFGFTNSAALDALTGLAAQALYRSGHSFSPHGRTFGTTPLLRLLLRQAGYSAIKQRASVVDYSAGTELHQSNVQNLLVVYQLLQPFLVQMQVASLPELQELYQQMEHEVQQADFCGIDYYLTVWGMK
ncbi:MAG TPA: class I SAM-dependent methyltransferase [Ktedonobacteraceae bacterium]|nr:class I SAM-dependent methyltransferase [Ktedonobacteraceae bacterium]